MCCVCVLRLFVVYYLFIFRLFESVARSCMVQKTTVQAGEVDLQE